MGESKDIGLRLKALRERRGWSIGSLATQSGVGKSWISKLERGVSSRPGIESLQKLAQALDVRIEDLSPEAPLKDLVPSRDRVRDLLDQYPDLRIALAEASKNLRDDEIRYLISTLSLMSKGRPEPIARYSKGRLPKVSETV